MTRTVNSIYRAQQDRLQVEGQDPELVRAVEGVLTRRDIEAEKAFEQTRRELADSATGADVDALAERVTTAESNINALDGRMDTAESKITALENKVQQRIRRFNLTATPAAGSTDTVSFNHNLGVVPTSITIGLFNTVAAPSEVSYLIRDITSILVEIEVENTSGGGLAVDVMGIIHE